MDWFNFAQDRDKWRSLVIEVWVPQNFGNFLTS